MKILILSDLHHEFGCPTEIPDDLDYDVVVLAGDIDVKTRGALWALETFPLDKPIIYTTGNHEYYGTVMGKVDRELLELNQEHPGRFFYLDGDQNSSYIINDVQFVGGTLWTDFELNHPMVTREFALCQARDFMTDYHKITIFKNNVYRKLHPVDVLDIHRKHLSSIKWSLETRPLSIKKSVIVTHHAMSARSINERYAHQEVTNPLYASNLDDFILDMEPTLCVHGHMHDPVDYMIGDSRIVASPRGYVTDKFREKNTSDVFKVVEI